ncbi:formate/nitrite transporter family protein [Tessaracoccus sp. OH4464_COT-324]|uniref:formate/nitrite transporter family protein n=1 Tax=Tessaracoccus sp. OH4464_COT-324 TaxID=2491059 RepID=UPI000F630B9A|nr:formate/nitrite transporter family protein [Tessaracoccus sp. OH4464_COT-324]RRD46642.1 formate transporter FocA [Tessaracoccus sp. OH4464_COT-324]
MTYPDQTIALDKPDAAAAAQLVASSGMLKKATTPTLATLASGTFAGLIIGLGFVFYTTTQVGASDMPWGMAKTVGGLVFSGALFVIMVLGLDLFTSSTMTTLPLVEGKLGPRRLLRHWGLVYFSNMLGATLLGVLILGSGTHRYHDGEWGAVLVKSALGKVGHTWVESFTLGVLCNLLVCIAVWVGFHGKSVVEKLAAVVFPIPMFVATGFEHSVANMFIVPTALAAKAEASPELMRSLGDVQLEGLTVEAYLWWNLLPVTLGNIVGGGLLVALGMWAWQRGKAGRAGE